MRLRRCCQLCSRHLVSGIQFFRRRLGQARGAAASQKSKPFNCCISSCSSCEYRDRRHNQDCQKRGSNEWSGCEETWNLTQRRSSVCFDGGVEGACADAYSARSPSIRPQRVSVGSIEQQKQCDGAHSPDRKGAVVTCGDQRPVAGAVDRQGDHSLLRSVLLGSLLGSTGRRQRLG